MLDYLPLEIVYQILAHVPYSVFPVLHEALPQHLVEVALLGKLKQQQQLQQEESLLKLVSTNRNELVAPFYKPRRPPGGPNQSLYHYTHHVKDSLERSNESSIPLFFKHMDLEHRIIWLAPDIKSTQYYFEVKDFYVSHGKLTLRQQRHQALQSGRGKPQEKVLGSLWDIRNKFPSSRSGNFSGVASQADPSILSASSPSPCLSPFSLVNSPSPSMRLSPQQQSGTFTMTMEASTNNTLAKRTMQQQTTGTCNTPTIPHISVSKNDSIRAIILDACCVLTLKEHLGHTDSNQSKDTTLTTTERYGFPPRPSVPWAYSHPLPVGTIQTTFPWDTSLCCGYFVVEQVAISISDFMDFL